jgi:hypothetical protein
MKRAGSAKAALGTGCVAAGALVMTLCLHPAGVASAAVTSTGSGTGASSDLKKCQQDGWLLVARSDGSLFTSRKDCAGYVRQGGALTRPTTVPEGVVDTCRYSGTPGVDGALLTAYSPELVTIKSLVPDPDAPPYVVNHDPVQVGDLYDADGGYRIVVAVPGDPAATIEDCPAG